MHMQAEFGGGGNFEAPDFHDHLISGGTTECDLRRIKIHLARNRKVEICCHSSLIVSNRTFDDEHSTKALSCPYFLQAAFVSHQHSRRCNMRFTR